MPGDLHLDHALGGAETAARRYRLLLADDHELLRDMLRRLLEPEFEIVGSVNDGEALLKAAQELAPDIVLSDVIMPRLGGLEAGRRLLALTPRTRLVFLTMESGSATAIEAFRLGASGFLLKACSTEELLHGLRIVAGGGHYLASAIADGDIQSLLGATDSSPAARLSPRELEVIRLLVTGLPMKMVARKLSIAPRTVAFHKYRAMQALGLRGNPQLIDFAVRNGLLGNHAPPPA